MLQYKRVLAVADHFSQIRKIINEEKKLLLIWTFHQYLINRMLYDCVCQRQEHVLWPQTKQEIV